LEAPNDVLTDEIVHNSLLGNWLWSPLSLLSNGYQGLFLWGVKQPGCEVDHSSPSSADVKECVELYLHSSSMPSWRGAQFKKNGERYTVNVPKF